MKPTAEIVCTYAVNPLTGDRYPVYEWSGPVHGMAEVDSIMFKMHQLPWPVEVLHDDWWRRRAYVCRTDWPWPWPLACNRAQAEADRMARFWQGFQARLIYTAQVWGLAYVAPGEVPSWACMLRKR